MSKLCLVTGANGFIGNRLIQPGDRRLVRNVADKPGEVKGDLLDSASLFRACEGVGTIYHCAGYAHAFSSSDPGAHYLINYEGTRNLLKAAGDAGVSHFVYLSSVKAMAEPGENCVNEDWPGEPTTPYGLAKRAAEDAVLEAGAKFGMHVVNLRLSMVYGKGGRGNLERMARAIRAGWFPPIPDTGNMRSLVHIQDVVDVVRLVAKRAEANSKTYIVADSQVYSTRELYLFLRTALGLSPEPLFTLPAGLFRAAGQVSSRLGEIVDRLMESSCYCPLRIEQELGWRARINLENGLNEMLQT